MRGHFVHSRRVAAAGTCLLLLGILMSSLVWAVGPSSFLPAGDTAPAGGEAAPAAVPARTGSLSAPVDPPDASRAVQDAWEKARDAGAYRFATQLSQVTYPATTLSNLGRGPQRSELSLSGRVDQPARTLEFRMWHGADDDIEARVEGDRAWVRQDGGEWEEVEDFSSSFAPDNDPLSFLAGVKDIEECALQARGSEEDAGTRGRGEVACYRFDLDGPGLAAYLRDRQKGQMAEAGELPASVDLGVSAALADVTGNGELWVDGRGLPVRLSMHLALPEESDGSHLEADVLTEFSGFPEEETAALGEPDGVQGVVGRAGSTPGLDDPSLPKKAGRAAAGAAVVACCLAVMALTVAHSRSRRVYVGVAMAITLSIVLVPLLQAQQVAAFYDAQAGGSQEVESLGGSGQATDAPGAAQQEAAARETAWNPQQDPLGQPDRATVQAVAASAPSLPLPPAGAPRAGVLQGGLASTSPCAADDTADEDVDGLSNYEECVYDTTVNNADSDGDGLSDGEELNKLGTNPRQADSDGDGLDDKAEVQGLNLGGTQ